MSIRIFCGLLFLIILSLPGCLVRTLYPLLEADDILLESTLTGEWETSENNEKWIFTSIYGGDYELTIIKCDTLNEVFECDTSSYTLRHGRIGEVEYINILPEAQDKFNSLYNNLMVPTNTFMKIEVTANTIYLYTPDYEKLEEYLKSDSTTLKHEFFKLGNEFIITAGSKELKEFVSSNQVKTWLFPEYGSKLKRINNR